MDRMGSLVSAYMFKFLCVWIFFFPFKTSVDNGLKVFVLFHWIILVYRCNSNLTEIG